MSKLFNLLKYELYKLYSKKSVLISMVLVIVFMLPFAINSSNDNTAIKAKSLVKEYYKTGDSVTKNNEIKEEEKYKFADYTNIFTFKQDKKYYEEKIDGLQKLLAEMKHKGDTGYAYKTTLMAFNMFTKLDLKAKPYYTGLWGHIQIITTSKSLIICLLLSLCLGLSGVFSDEYSQGVDSLILSSKYGKKAIISAKILASCIYSLSITLILGISVIVSSALAYGSLEGYSSPMQIVPWYGDSPYNLNLLQLSVLKLFMILIGTLACGMLILMCSSRIRNSLVTFFISLAAVFVPSYIVENMGVSKLALLDSYGYFLSPEELLNKFYTFNILGIPVLSLVVYGVALVIFSVISVYFMQRSFRKHQATN